MKKLSRLFAPVLLALFLLVPPSGQSLLSAPNQKQGGKANNNKKTAAQKKKEAEQRKKAQERAEAERKRKAEEERKRKQAIETARKKRLLDRVEEAKSGIRKCSAEARGLATRYQKMIDGRALIARSIDLLVLKPAKEKSEDASARLLKIEAQFKAKAKDLQGAALSLEGLKNSEKKTQSKGGTAETWEKTLLDLKRELSSVNATVRSGESSNKSYGGFILSLIPEYVRAGVKFSEKEKTLIKKLSSL